MSISTCTPHAEKDCVLASSAQPGTEDVEWLEMNVAAGFRVWQIMFLCFAGLLTLVIFLCCCIRFRIPRTKQEIEADYIRKKLAKKFRKQLRLIQNSELDNMDLKRGTVQPRSDFHSRSCAVSTVGREPQVPEIQDHPLDRVRAEIKSDTDSLPQSDVSLSSGCCNCPSPALPPCEPHLTDRQLTKKATTFRKASDFTAV
ncbi:uncharacterized protein LOC110827283 isoform X3 [Zootermopsis nevadensis]|uniref:uncharacterized protein LOC110827283 isoform X3 n=1 Tax=Zootermopsis nevadensis TaxID=136037 RepID=UPI000B8ECF25|nr:uncharacterized protein LOC110827283 isoform X3 [Zootermopsis nevadensis]